jgi:DNA-binding transcriptional MocR family regulator
VLLLSELGVTASAAQIVLTQGTSQALDLIIRHYIKPGDAVLVDDPGYYNLFGNLRQHGARLLGVPRKPDGPDLAALAQLAAEHRPRIYFTQSALQNPTGTDMSPHVGFRVLQLAEQFDFLIVRMTFSAIFRSGTHSGWPLSQLNRVIAASRKSCRAAFASASWQRAFHRRRPADVKMLSSITSFSSSSAYSCVLIDGHYRKFLTRLHKRLGESRLGVIQAFERIGLELFVEPEAGMFLWARFPHVSNALALTKSASSHGIMIAPGVVFRPHLQPSPWMRFNVTACDDPHVYRWLEHIAARPKADWVRQAAE